MRKDEEWALEYARRKAIGQAVFLSPDIDSYRLSAQAFILTLSEANRKELSRYIGTEGPHGVLIAMQEPDFLRRKRGIALRLAVLGWDPFQYNPPLHGVRPRARPRGRGDFDR